MILKNFLNLIFLTNFAFGYLSYPRCTNIITTNTVLNSLNGRVQGACYSVTVNYGGYKPNVAKNVLTWLSVPYAQPPVGSLRFRNPVPVQSWQNIKDGTDWSYSCIQIDNSGVYEPFASEDCLYLNIFVPYDVYNRAVVQKNDLSRVPIYIWVHGGHNVFGAAAEYDSTTLAAMSDVIVVAINYRLGPFGFFNVLNTDAKGNQGFFDQTLAFKWVFDNAHLFGGDRTKITIGGESSGSWDNGLHLLYKPSWPYFNRVIMQSGSPMDLSTKLKTAQEVAQYAVSAGKKLGCTVLDGQALLSCLQSKDAKSFYMAAYQEFKDFSDLFTPLTLDPNVFSQQPRTLFETGNFKQAEVLIGTTTHEFLSYAPRIFMNYYTLRLHLEGYLQGLPFDFQKYFQIYNLKNTAGFYDKIIEIYGLTTKNKNSDFYQDFVQIMTDACLKCPSYLFSETLARFNQKSYVFLYGHKASTVNRPEDGADHAEELPFVFAEPLDPTSKYPVYERVFTEQILNYWTSFIKFSNLNLQNSATGFWPEFKTDAGSLRNVFFLKAQNITNTKYNIQDPRCAFWNL